jgi:hypothetical protein
LNQLVDIYEIQYGDYSVEGDHYYILFNTVGGTIPKWRTFKHLRWIQNLLYSTWDHEILYADRPSKDEQDLLRTFFMINLKYEHGGRFNFKINVLFL